MNLNPLRETVGQDDQSWLGSAHGTSMGRSITLDLSTFDANTHYPKGYLLSGLPLGKITASSKYGPYDDAALDGRETLEGFLLSPVRAIWYGPGSTVTDAHGALYEHGRVVAANLPIAVDDNGKTDVAGRIIFA